MGWLLGLGGVALTVLLVVVGGVIWGVGSAAGWGKSRKRELGPAKSKKPYAYLDTSKDLNKDSVLKIVEGYVDDETLGSRARGVVSTFDTAELRRKGIFSILGQEFDQGSITWDKFSAPVDVAIEGITRNAAQIANRMQAFDAAEYRRMDRIERAGGYGEQRTELERLAVMRASMGEMDEFQHANERLLVELEKLQAELTKLTGAGFENDTDQIAEEIRKLTDETHYYA